MPRLNKRFIDSLKPRAKPSFTYDDNVPGFGIRVQPSGAKTFILEYRPRASGQGAGRHIAPKRFTIGRYGPLTPDQAREAAMSLLVQIRAGVDPQIEKAEKRAELTVSALIEAFMAQHVTIDCKPRTREAYRYALARLKAKYGNARASDLARAQVAKMHLDMATTPYVANQFRAVVASLYSWADRQGLLPEGHNNPAERIKRYKEAKRDRFLSTEELGRLGDALREVAVDPYAVAAIRLLLLTGARLREVLHAKWEYVDSDRGLLNLPDSKTGKKTIFLSAPALAILAGLPQIEGNPHIIPGSKAGQPRADLGRPWEAITKAAGLDGLRIHDLRHSFASIGAGTAMSLPMIGKLLGHSQPATTARYAHLDSDPMRRAVNTIGVEIETAMRARR